MNCPRCFGLTIPALLVSLEDDLDVLRCPLCGWYGGERVIEFHHHLPVPPPPRPDAEMPGERISRK